MAGVCGTCMFFILEDPSPKNTTLPLIPINYLKREEAVIRPKHEIMTLAEAGKTTKLIWRHPKMHVYQFLRKHGEASKLMGRTSVRDSGCRDFVIGSHGRVGGPSGRTIHGRQQRSASKGEIVARAVAAAKARMTAKVTVADGAAAEPARSQILTPFVRRVFVCLFVVFSCIFTTCTEASKFICAPLTRDLWRVSALVDHVCACIGGGFSPVVVAAVATAAAQLLLQYLAQEWQKQGWQRKWLTQRV